MMKSWDKRERRWNLINAFLLLIIIALTVWSFLSQPSTSSYPSRQIAAASRCEYLWYYLCGVVLPRDSEYATLQWLEVGWLLVFWWLLALVGALCKNESTGRLSDESSFGKIVSSGYEKWGGIVACLFTLFVAIMSLFEWMHYSETYGRFTHDMMKVQIGLCVESFGANLNYLSRIWISLACVSICREIRWNLDMRRRHLNEDSAIISRQDLTSVLFGCLMSFVVLRLWDWRSQHILRICTVRSDWSGYHYFETFLGVFNSASAFHILWVISVFTMIGKIAFVARQKNTTGLPMLSFAHAQLFHISVACILCDAASLLFIICDEMKGQVTS
jgi:hypothetical protein